MTENLYRPGAWLAVVGLTAAALVDDLLPQPALDGLWQAIRTGQDVEELLDGLAAGQQSAPPTFGVVISDGDLVRVHVRAGVSALVHSPAGKTRSIDCEAVSTRVVYRLADVSKVTLYRSGDEGQTPSLPIGTGIVPADSLDWIPAAAPAGNPEASNGSGPSIAQVPDLIDGVPPPPALTLSVAPPLPPPLPPPPGDAFEDEIGLSAPPVTQDSTGDHDGHTVTRSALGVMSKKSVEGPTVLAVRCSQQHANPQEAERCRICDEMIVDQEPESISRPNLGFLRFSTGQYVVLDRRVIVGRSPSIERVSGEDLPQLVQLDSPDQDISRSHAEIRLEGWQVLAVDLDSINGTVVTLPDGRAERLHPHEPFVLLPGAVVDLAGEVTFAYEKPT